MSSVASNQTSTKQRAGSAFTLENAPWLILAAVVVLFTIYVRVRLLGVPLERDEGEYAYMGQLMLKGIPPFASAYSMKLPGIYSIYALFLALFGHSVQGIHLGLLLANLLTVAAVFLIGKRICDLRAGAAAAAVYALLSVSYTVFGVFAHATHFVMLFAAAGFLCLFAAFDRDSRLLILVTGVLFGISLTMKQHAAPIILFALTYLVREGGRKGMPVRKLAGSAILFTVGVTLPYLAWVAYLYAAGVFDKFWFWTVRYAAEYAANTPFSVGRRIFSRQIGNVTATSSWLWICAVIQFLLLAIGRVRRSDRFFLIGFFLATFAAVVPGYYFRGHYFVMMLPAVALLVGSAASALSGAFPAKGTLLRNCLAVSLVILLCSQLLVREQQYLVHSSPRQVNTALYTLNPFAESLEVASYLKANTSPNDRIAILGSEPQILFYADRISATGHIYMYGLMEEQPFASHMQAELMSDVASARPKYLVMAAVDYSWLVRPKSDRTIFGWAEKFISQNYDLVGLANIEGPENRGVYWGSDAMQFRQGAPSQLLVYRAR